MYFMQMRFIQMQFMQINSIFRFCDFLLILILLTVIGIATGFVLSDPPDGIKYIPHIQTCIYLDSSTRKVYFVSVAAYTMLVFGQGTAIF